MKPELCAELLAFTLRLRETPENLDHLMMAVQSVIVSNDVGGIYNRSGWGKERNKVTVMSKGVPKKF